MLVIRLVPPPSLASTSCVKGKSEQKNTAIKLNQKADLDLLASIIQLSIKKGFASHVTPAPTPTDIHPSNKHHSPIGQGLGLSPSIVKGRVKRDATNRIMLSISNKYLSLVIL